MRRAIGSVVIVAFAGCSQCGSLPGATVEPTPGAAPRALGPVRTTPPDRSWFEVAVYDPNGLGDRADSVARECAGLTIVDALGAPGVPSAVVAVRTDYPPPNMEALAYFGRGIEEADAVALQRADRALVVTMMAAPEQAMAAARELTTCIARVAAPSGYVWDEETRLLYSLDAWQAGPVADWDDGIPSFGAQVTVHAMHSDDDDTLRAVSLGMRKFARSDLAVPVFYEQHHESLGRLLSLVGQTMLEGAEPEGAIHLDLAALHERDVRATMGTPVTPIDLALEPVGGESGDPENRLLAPTFPGEGPLVEREAEAFASLFGADREIGHLDPDATLEALSRTARAELALLRPRFVAGLPTGQRLEIFAIFPSPGADEIMWVGVTSWTDAEHIEGRLMSEPRRIAGLHSGASVRVAIDDVADYAVRGGDGQTLAGGAAHAYGVAHED